MLSGKLILRVLGTSILLLEFLLWTIILYVLGTLSFILGWLTPQPSLKRWLIQQANKVPSAWSSLIFHTQHWFYDFDIHTHIDGMLDKKKSYLVVSNHQSAVDIFIIHELCAQYLSMPRFFVKRELTFIPLWGWFIKMLNYPALRRKNGSLKKNKDYEDIKKFCERFKTMPVTIISFAEGTRFTQEKHEAQTSPYRHLLKPKSGGIAQAINALPHVDTIIDVTIDYHKTPCTLMSYLTGRLRTATVFVTAKPITPDLRGDYENDREYRKHLQSWINNLWAEKDAQLSRKSP